MSFLNDAFSVIAPAAAGFLVGGPGGAIAGGAAGLGTVLQNQRNQENIDRQNAYNSPANQMSRYRAAGLNPNLIYTSGSSSNQPQPVQTSAPALDMLSSKARILANERAKHENVLAKYNAEAGFYAADRAYADALVKTAKQRNLVLQNQLLDPVAENANALARYNLQHQEALVNQLLNIPGLQTQQLLNLEKDFSIKEEVLARERHYNYLRALGIEPRDNLMFRAGASIFHDYIPRINQSLGLH